METIVKSVAPLTELEQEVLQFLRKSCVNNNQTFKKMAYKIQTKFRSTNSESQNLINTFVKRNIIKIDSNEVIVFRILGNDIRANLFSLIKKFPGIHLNELKRTLKIESNQLYWHLGVLMNEGCLSEYRFGKFLAFSTPQTLRNHVILGFLLFKDTIRNLLQCYLEHKSFLSELDIENILQQSHSSISYQQKTLRKFKLLESKKIGRTNKYSIKTEFIPFLTKQIPLIESFTKNF